MNKAEFKAIQIIAQKMNWQQKPVSETIETINQMVRNQQALELDTVGECDGDEETLLSIALWDKDNILSTQYVSDYVSLCMWPYVLFSDDMGMYPSDLCNMITYYNCIQPEIFEEQDFEEFLADEYYYECLRDAMWINKHC